MSNTSAPILFQFLNVHRWRAAGPLDLPVVGDLDVEGQRPLRERVAAVEDLRHDLVAEIEVGAFNLRLSAATREDA